MINYIIIHTQGNIVNDYGPYRNIGLVSESLDRFMDEVIETEADTIEVFAFDVTEVEAKYGEKLEYLDMYDIADDRFPIRKIGVVVSLDWKEVSE